MRRREVLAQGVATSLLGGCAVGAGAGKGETASYALYNGTNDQAFETATLTDADRRTELNAVLRMPSPIATDLGWRGGGTLFPADTGHRIPGRVKVFWRLPPREGQKRYQGELIGPFEIELRSRLPPEVLETVRESRMRRRLEIAISVGVLPIQVRWQLVEPDPTQGLRTMRRGGNW